MLPVSDNPFAALTLIVAPAVLTNASSILTFVTSNRYIVLLDRWRTVAADLEAMPAEAPERPLRVGHIARLERRGKLLLRGLRFLYLAIGLFALSALVSLLGASLAFVHGSGTNAFVALGILTGVAAVVSLLAALVCLGSEAALSTAHIAEEATILRVRSGSGI